MKKIKIVLVVLISVLLFSACTPHNTVVYTNEELGFNMDIPKSWKDKYLVENGENSIIVSHKTLGKKDEKAFLFSITRVIGELITEEDVEWSYTPQKLLGSGQGYSFILSLAEDLQYEPEDLENSKEYEEMREDINTIIHSFKIDDNLEKPKSANNGYKLIGSNFFRFEIEDNFNLKKSKSSPFIWEILNGDKDDVGDVELSLYNEDEFQENGMITQYFRDEELKRSIRVSIKDDYVKDMEVIKTTMEILGDNYTSLDEIYSQRQILKDGGKELVGRIEAIKLDGLQVKNITIKSKNKTREYKADFPNIVPMKNGNYTLYQVYPFTKNYILSDGEYREKNYEFIFSKHNEIVGLIEIPR